MSEQEEIVKVTFRLRRSVLTWAKHYSIDHNMNEQDVYSQALDEFWDRHNKNKSIEDKIKATANASTREGMEI